MSKVRIKTTINEKKSIFIGIKKQNRIIYNDIDILVAIDIADIVTLRRENSEFKLNLIFDKNKNTKGIYLLKKSNKYLELQVKTEELIIESNNIKIIYHIVDGAETIEFKLEFEEI